MSKSQSESELEKTLLESLVDSESEAHLENKLIKSLKSKKYRFVNIKNEKDLLKNFRIEISEHNKSELNGSSLSDTEFDKLLETLYGKGIFNSAIRLRGKEPLTRDDGSIVNLSLFNQKDWCKNRFQVSNQITVEGKRVNRYDVTILINGLPLVQIELKRPGLELKQAFNQINRYKSDSFTKLFKYIQIFVVSNGVNTKYISNTNKKLNYNFAFTWTDEFNKHINNLSDFAKTFLDTCHIAKVISRYMVLNKTDKKLMVMRPYQIYAVEKLVKKASETKSNGYVWHTTGSGKTLTSFKLSNIIKNLEDVKKVIFLVDRRDLDAQTISEFNKFEKDSVDLTSNTKNLLSKLSSDSDKLIITTIQKMNKAIGISEYSRFAKVMDQYKKERVIFIIDECHRSQFGDMHKKIKKHFNNAQYFGFTGTPIFRENVGLGLATGNLFDEQVHAYMIKDGIRDKNVLGFKVDYISTFRSNKNIVDEDVEDIDKKEVLESDSRVDRIVDEVIKIHPIKSLRKRYNAIFVASSIEMAVKYYRKFKEKKHDLKIASIFTYGVNDENANSSEQTRDKLESVIVDYNEIFSTNYSTDTYSSYFIDLSKRFKNKEIDVLIVVNMFLTGYDSKLLNTLYVDKKIKMHNLIQSFSRTNRIHNNIKQFGNIVCFQTKRVDVENAIKVYSNSDSIDTVILDPYDKYITAAIKTIYALKAIAPTVDSVDDIESEKEKLRFIEAFRRLMRIISVLNNFIEFDIKGGSLENMSDKEYKGYTSKYKDMSIEVIQSDKVSILSDVDFELELLARDIINVDYILKLLNEINLDDDKQKKIDIERIKKILNQNETAELRSKIDLLKKFIENVVPTLHKEDVVEEKYQDFITIEKEIRINDISRNSGTSPKFIKDIISSYQFSNVIPNKVIREQITGKYLDKRDKIKIVKEFIIDYANTF